MRRFAAAIAVLTLLIAAPAGAREEIPAELRHHGFSADISSCESGAVLARIQSRFSANERQYWNSTAEILTVEKVQQVAFRPHGLDLIPRRYCKAVAVMADRSRRNLHYAIIEKAGIVSFSEGIQYCLDGYDRNHTAMAGCRRIDR